jgi:hypothetical protein
MSKVLPKDWEAPDHLPISSRKFLVERAERINTLIKEKDEAIRNIECAYYFKVGQALLAVKRKFKSDPEFNRWFKRWLLETTDIDYQKATRLTVIAERAESNTVIAELTSNIGECVLYQVVSMPEEFRNEMLELIQNDEVKADLKRGTAKVKQMPEYEYAVLSEKILSLHSTIAKYHTKPPKDRRHLPRTEAALNKALIRMAELKAELDGKTENLSTQELILKTLRQQMKQTQVQVEELISDPETKKNRALAQTVNDANKGIDLLLSALDRFTADKPELADHAIQTIERKLEVLKKKLYAT